MAEINGKGFKQLGWESLWQEEIEKLSQLLHDPNEIVKERQYCQKYKIFLMKWVFESGKSVIVHFESIEEVLASSITKPN